jgi:hypothetical protein
MVHAFAGELQAKQIAIELQTVGSVLDDNRRVIDAEKELAIRVLPARVAFFWGKIDDLQVVTVGIFEIKGNEYPRRFCWRLELSGARWKRA